MLAYVGTYTRGGAAEGVYVYRLDPASGALTRLQAVPGAADPTYLALGPTARVLYAVDGDTRAGAISAYARDPRAGTLAFLNRAPTGASHPSHVAVHPAGRWVLAADYHAGHVSSLPVLPDGGVGPAAHVLAHAGAGPHPTRQTSPHPHQAVCDPRGRVVLVPDLGTDQVVAYRFDPASGALTAVPDGGLRLPPGAGPRHLAFHPRGDLVYLVTELASTLVACAYDPEAAALRPLQTLPLLPADWSGESTAAAVVVHPSGRFVYASNRGHDSVAAFAVDPATGHLRPLGHTPSGGQVPRDVNLDPDGAFLVAANQDSDALVVFRVDARTGALVPTGHAASVPRPVRVLFATEDG